VVNRSKFSSIFDARKGLNEEEPGKRGRGRPRGYAGGKRENKEEYTQASAYIRRDVHKQVKSALALEDKEFSELVEELLERWLKSRS
jgi:ribosomal protein L19E